MLPTLTTVADNDDAYPGAPGGFSFISQAVKSNQTYDIAVDGYDAASGNVSLSYSFTPATVYHVIAGNTAGGTVQLIGRQRLGRHLDLARTSRRFCGRFHRDTISDSRLRRPVQQLDRRIYLHPSIH